MELNFKMDSKNIFTILSISERARSTKRAKMSVDTVQLVSNHAKTDKKPDTPPPEKTDNNISLLPTTITSDNDSLRPPTPSAASSPRSEPEVEEDEDEPIVVDGSDAEDVGAVEAGDGGLAISPTSAGSGSSGRKRKTTKNNNNRQVTYRKINS